MRHPPYLAPTALALLLFLAGCRPAPTEHGHEHGEGEPHEHEERTAQITVWSDRYEVFAEHLPPVVDEPVQFITHVTDLQDQRPRTEGMIKFVFTQDDQTFEHPQAAPARPGIYLPAIRFPQTGPWQTHLQIPTDGTNASVDLGTIQVYPDAHSAAHADLPPAPEGISFLKEQQWKMEFDTQPVTRRDLAERIQVPATVRPKPGFHAAVTAPLAGQLIAPSGHPVPQPGATVEAGQVLALLEPRFSDVAAAFVQIEAEFGRAEAQMKQAQAAYERVKSLASQQARSQRDLQEAEAALAAARAGYQAAASLRSTYSPTNAPDSSPQAVLELRAPIAGIITSMAAGPGEPVQADQVLFTILNPSPVWVQASLPEHAASRISTPTNALIQFPDAPSGFVSIPDQGGQLIFTGLEINPTNRTVPLIYELPNTNLNFRIGQALRLHVESARSHDAIAIPESAIVEEGGQPIAFIQLSGETFAKRELRLGIQDGPFRQVLAGLEPGDRVVTRGAYPIRLSSLSGAIPAHGHAH